MKGERGREGKGGGQARRKWTWKEIGAGQTLQTPLTKLPADTPQ